MISHEVEGDALLAMWAIEQKIADARKRKLTLVDLFQVSHGELRFENNGLWDQLYRIFHIQEPLPCEFPKKEWLIWTHLSERGFPLSLSLCRFTSWVDTLYWVVFCDVSGDQTVFE